jgi:uncharacterized membrane protein (UPF0127 family)
VTLARRSRPPRRLRAVAALAALAVTAACRSGSAGDGSRAAAGPAGAPRVVLDSPSGRSAAVTVEVVRAPAELERGLMFRERLAPDAGMLFVFPGTAVHTFWMKNTLIPLSVAFIADDGTVVNIDEMKPQTLNPHCSTQPVRFVREMNTGWFSKKGVKAGSKLSGEPFGTPR